MKKIVLLAFLCVATSRAFGAVGCTGYDTMSSCNSSSDALMCYWGYTRDYANGPVSYKCYECTNLPLTDHILVDSRSETQPDISLLTAKTERIIDGNYHALGNTDGFCPILVSCPVGYGLKLYTNLLCNSSSIQSDCRYYVSCEKCGMGTFDRETRFVRVYAAGNSNDGGMFYVRGERTDFDGNSIYIVETNIRDSELYGCGTCGANAHVNTAGNSCDCDDGYGYYDYAGRVSTTNVGENNCVPRTYKIYLNTGSTASSDSKYIKYRPGTGYDLDLDGVYGDDGTSLDSVVSVTTPKKDFKGWYFCGCSQGMECACDAPMWTSNTIKNSDNIVDTCKKNTDFIGCSIDEYDTINLYKWWSWKNYTVKYSDGSNKTKTCRYNSDCVIDYNPTTTVPDGQLFVNWLYSSRAINVGDNIKTIEQSQSSEFSSNAIELDPAYTDCGAGYYCVAGVKNMCPGGYVCRYLQTSEPVPCGPTTYCPKGSSSTTICPAGYYCPEKTENPIPCDPGYYCPRASGSQESCPAGYYCPVKEDGGADTPTPCGAGYYCLANASQGSLCPVGTTSDGGDADIPGATAIADCYISSETQFTDNISSFSLPIYAGTVKYMVNE